MPHFCQIAPTAYLDDFCQDNEVDLILAHLVETDEAYVEFYKNHDAYKIMDNSAFEMYKQGRPMYESEKLLEMGKRVNADVIVMSDYPGEHSSKTIEAAERLGPTFKENGFDTFFVPQSEIGDMEDYLDAWKYAASSPLVDVIGVSILGVPNAFGNIESDNKLQRFLSRWKIMQILEQEGILDTCRHNGKKLHFLGALDGWAGEVDLVRQYHDDIFSWDSSGAVWAGLHGIAYDDSPTMQIDGKFELEVDFDHKDAEIEAITLAHYNIGQLKAQVR